MIDSPDGASARNESQKSTYNAALLKLMYYEYVFAGTFVREVAKVYRHNASEWLDDLNVLHEVFVCSILQRYCHDSDV